MNRRWDLITLGVIVNMCLGTVYSWSVFRGPLEIELGLQAEQLGTPYSVFLALFAFSMPVGGLLQARLGTRGTLVIGGILVGAGWILAGMVATIPLLVLTYGVLGGLGVGLAYGVPLAVASSWFPARRGVALGITLTGFGLSPFVTAPAAATLIARYGVSVAFRVLGLAFLVVILGLSVFFRRAPVDAESEAESSDNDLGPRDMLRTRAFYVLWICFALGTFSGLTAIGMTASFGMQLLSLESRAAATAVAIFGICNGLGRPLFGWLTDRFGTRAAAVTAFSAILVGAFLVLQAEVIGLPAFYAGFAILWMLLGGWLAIAPAATTRLFGPSRYAENYGIMYTGYGVGALAGGGVAAVLISLTSSQLSPFWGIMAVAAVGILVSRLFLPRR